MGAVQSKTLCVKMRWGAVLIKYHLGRLIIHNVFQTAPFLLEVIYMDNVENDDRYIYGRVGFDLNFLSKVNEKEFLETIDYQSKALRKDMLDMFRKRKAKEK